MHHIVPVRLGGDDDGDDTDRGNGDVALLEAPPKVKEPPLYKVIMLNDDYTPMDFVVEVLQTFFRIGHDQAVQIMLTVHTKGKAVVGVYTAEIAETKAVQVNEYARSNQHPLMCTLEKA